MFLSSLAVNVVAILLIVGAVATFIRRDYGEGFSVGFLFLAAASGFLFAGKMMLGMYWFSVVDVGLLTFSLYAYINLKDK